MVSGIADPRFLDETNSNTEFLTGKKLSWECTGGVRHLVGISWSEIINTTKVRVLTILRETTISASVPAQETGEKKKKNKFPDQKKELKSGDWDQGRLSRADNDEKNSKHGSW